MEELKVENRLKLMIADDNSNFTVACKNVFKSRGLDVVVVPHDGKAILDAIKSQKPDVVLTDAFLPHFDKLFIGWNWSCQSI